MAANDRLGNLPEREAQPVRVAKADFEECIGAIANNPRCRSTGTPSAASPSRSSATTRC